MSDSTNEHGLTNEQISLWMSKTPEELRRLANWLFATASLLDGQRQPTAPEAPVFDVTEDHLRELALVLDTQWAPKRRDRQSVDWAGYLLGHIIGVNLADKAAHDKMEHTLRGLIERGTLKVYPARRNGRRVKCVRVSGS